MSLYGPLMRLEEERRRRRIEDLDKKFKATIRHLEEIKKANDDFYKAKKVIFDSQKKRR